MVLKAKSQQRAHERATAQKTRNEFAISKLQQTLEARTCCPLCYLCTAMMLYGTRGITVTYISILQAYKHQASEKLNRASVL